MAAIPFFAQFLLVLVGAIALAGFVLALLSAPPDGDAIAPDLPGGHQRARRAEHHDDQHVLHAQLALDEQGAEGFEGGVVDMFHALKSLFLARFPSGK